MTEIVATNVIASSSLKLFRFFEFSAIFFSLGGKLLAYHCLSGGKLLALTYICQIVFQFVADFCQICGKLLSKWLANCLQIIGKLLGSISI